MKLSELRENARDGRWETPSAMRWHLDIGSLTELVRDIDQELDKAKTGGYLQGIREYSEKRIAAMSRDLTHQWHEEMLGKERIGVGAVWRSKLSAEQVSAAQCQQLSPAEHAMAVLNLRLDELKKLVDAVERRHSEHANWHESTRFGKRIGELERDWAALKARPWGEIRATAPADSELGVELSKIRDRLNALETKAPGIQPSVNDRLDSLDIAVKSLELNVDEHEHKLEKWRD